MKFLRRQTAVAVAAAVVVAAAAVAGGVAVAGGGSTEEPITGEAYDRAAAAALDFTGGGTVTDTEVGDEEGTYEVEVTLEDGSQLDVHLDENFVVISSERDEAGEDDDDDDDDEEGDDD